MSLTFLYLSIFSNQFSRYPDLFSAVLECSIKEHLSWSSLVPEWFLLWFFDHPSSLSSSEMDIEPLISKIQFLITCIPKSHLYPRYIFWSLVFLENHSYYSSQHLPRLPVCQPLYSVCSVFFPPSTSTVLENECCSQRGGMAQERVADGWLAWTLVLQHAVSELNSFIKG